MSEQIAKRFIDALERLETRNELEPLVSMFAPDCDVANVTVTHPYHGRDGAREFWTSYRQTFGQIRSKFRNIVAKDNRVVLEWTTEATDPKGHPVHYEGVSVLELQGDQITHFRAYFDPRALGRQVEKARGAVH